MPELLLDPLAASLHGALERVQAATGESGARTHAARALISAAQAIGEGDLLATLQAEAVHLDALTQAVADAAKALDLAQAEVAGLHTGTMRLTNALSALVDAEQIAVVHIEDVEADLDGIDAQAAGWADALQQAIAHEFDPLVNAADAAVQQVASVADATAAAADSVAGSLAEWTQSLEHDAQTVLGAGWERLASSLGEGLAAADRASAATLDHSGSMVEVDLFGTASTTAEKVTSSAEQVSGALHDISEAIRMAKAFQEALHAASGML